MCSVIMVRTSGPKGVTDKVTDVVVPWVTKVNWLSYGDKMQRSPVQSPKIVPFKGMVKDIWTACDGNLNISEKDAKAIFALVNERKRALGSWPLMKCDEENWITSMAAQLRTLLGHVRDAYNRKERPGQKCS